jgi:hypothetical protein
MSGRPSPEEIAACEVLAAEILAGCTGMPAGRLVNACFALLSHIATLEDGLLALKIAVAARQLAASISVDHDPIVHEPPSRLQ